MTTTEMNATEIGKLAATAGSLLLNEPDAGMQTNLQCAGYTLSGEKSVRQLFFDRLGIPQSGLYLPPYEHVFRKREWVEVEGMWHFPPARHDGALDVERIYRSWGFQRSKVPTSPLFAGAHLPGDHLGFMLVFAGFALQGTVTNQAQNQAFAMSVKEFIEEHLGDWVDSFCELLPVDNTAGYLEALADAVQDAVALLRGWCADGESITGSSATGASRKTSPSVDHCG